jgi:Helix-hairpin-helix containing domain/AAA domain
MVFLQGVGVSTSLAVRICKTYGDGSISVVRDEPYRLAAEVWGIGFKTADAIAQAVGIPHDSPQWVQAGLQYTLSEAADHGHCFLPEPNLVTDAAQILGVDADLVRACLADLAGAEGVIREPVPGMGGGTVPAVYLVPFHRAETALAAALMRLSTTPTDRMPAFASVDWGKALAWLRARTGAELAAEQEQAVRLALTSKVAVLTGGPGCGKSFTVKSVITLAAAKRVKVVLAAPTGRAAKRLTELSGHPATTVHRVGADPVTSCDLPVLVYEAAEAVSSQRSERRFGRWGSGACGRLLMQRSVGAMSVVVLDVLLQHQCEVAWSGDQHVVEACAAQGADKALGDRGRRGARTGVRRMAMSAPAKTAAKTGMNLASRSRIKNRNCSARSPRSISRLRAC